MSFNSKIHHRHSIRLKGYDYSQPGACFVTMCTQNRERLFGKIVDGEMILNDAGKIAEQCLLAIPEHFSNAKLHEHVVMPNHIHCIIEIMDDGTDENIVAMNENAGTNPIEIETRNAAGANHAGANHDSPLHDSPHPDNSPRDDDPSQQPPKHPTGTSKTVGSIVRGFKIGVTKWFRENSYTQIIWQRNYHERIIRDDKHYANIARYILNNPAQWKRR